MMHEQLLDLNSFQTFLNRHQSDPTFYDNFFNYATSADTWKTNNRLSGLPTPPSTPGSNDCRFSLFVDNTPQVHFGDGSFAIPYQNDEFPTSHDFILSPISSPEEKTFQYTQCMEEKLTKCHKDFSKTHAVLFGRNSQYENLSNEPNLNPFNQYYCQKNLQYRKLSHNVSQDNTQHKTHNMSCVHYLYNQGLQCQSLVNDSPKNSCSGNSYLKSNLSNNLCYGYRDEHLPYVTANHSLNQELFEALFTNESASEMTVNATDTTTAAAGNKNYFNKNLHRRSQTQYFRQLAYEKIRMNPQQKLNTPSYDETEPELSKAAHNVLERQRRNELKLRFNFLRDEIPDLAMNDKAPKIQILKRGQEMLKDLKAQEQKLIVDHELEKQRQIILLNRIKYLQSGLI
ncbi:transcriptional regulator Myc-A [Hydra vulgaris]|uniref:Transcriptional regulator Myc-A n=1 Tax=Hydra vulgaris TaxID=6087 RepID=A0ABM4BAP3_HYDVU